VKEFGGIVLGVFALIAYGIFKFVMRLLKMEVESDTHKCTEHHRGFGINYMMRRRRLDATRDDSSFKTSVGKKIKKQRQGMTQRGKKKRR